MRYRISTMTYWHLTLREYLQLWYIKGQFTSLPSRAPSRELLIFLSYIYD
jgi:hypothetical protein